MTRTTSDDQEFCLAIMKELGIDPVAIQPKPPAPVCDAIMQISQTGWLIITNTLGRFRVIILDETTQKEAWAYFGKLNPGPTTNPRAFFIDREGEPPIRHN